MVSALSVPNRSKCLIVVSHEGSMRIYGIDAVHGRGAPAAMDLCLRGAAVGIGGGHRTLLSCSLSTLHFRPLARQGLEEGGQAQFATFD